MGRTTYEEECAFSEAWPVGPGELRWEQVLGKDLAGWLSRALPDCCKEVWELGNGGQWVFRSPWPGVSLSRFLLVLYRTHRAMQLTHSSDDVVRRLALTTRAEFEAGEAELAAWVAAEEASAVLEALDEP